MDEAVSIKAKEKTMGLTRKFLNALGIEETKVDEILEAHRKVVDEIKEERDKLKDSSEELEKTKKELSKLRDEIDKNDFEEKYNQQKKEYDQLKSDFESFKSNVDKKEKEQTLKSAYKKLLKDSGISEKRIDAVMRVSDLSNVELDDEGNIKDSEKLTENIKSEWSDFIATESQVGASTPTPVKKAGEPDKGESRAAKMVARYRSEHYGNPMKEV